ncbi:MAG: hypothetical protein QG656_697, partial [Candidatus Hydrogenedentes bacterium]|nr:hypothetical protein [Candidatus Hydrogenedentota bacterium]
MPHPEMDRSQLSIRPLSERKDKVYIERDHVPLDATPKPFSAPAQAAIDETVARIVQAREAGKPRMLTFGAHTIKNGLSPVLIKLIEDGWITHLATNGAGIIHDWEFAFQGHSSEDVRENVSRGRFGVWQETGFYINLAILVGAYRGMGYGESVGAFVEHEGLDIPKQSALVQEIVDNAVENPAQSAAAADLLTAVKAHGLEPGWMKVPHPFKQYGLQSAAYRLGVPFTGHPMIGHDIIYVHPMNHCAAIGSAAQRDFLAYAQNVSQLDGGVYLS